MCFYVDSNYLMIKLQRNLCAPTCPTVTTFELRDYGKMPYVLRVFTALSAKKIKVGLVILHLFNIYIYIITLSLPVSDITKRPTQSYHISASLDISEYKNHSYHIIHGNMSWYAAQKSCVERGAALASVTNPFQQAYLSVLINRLGTPHWIGLYSTDVWGLPFHTYYINLFFSPPVSPQNNELILGALELRITDIHVQHIAKLWCLSLCTV